MDPYLTTELIGKYIERNWWIIPISENDKKPLTKWGHLEKPLTAYEIFTEIRKDKNNNIRGNLGVLTGKKSGIIVFDIDDELYKNDLFKNVEIDTLVSKRTNRRGHIYFKYNPKIKDHIGSDKNDTNFLNIEVKSNGRYVVVPPSTHRSGNIYKFNDNDKEIQEIPEEMIKNWNKLLNLNNEMKKYMRSAPKCIYNAIKNNFSEIEKWKSDGAIAADLRNKGFGIDLFKFIMKYVYREDYNENDTEKAWEHAKEIKPWNCEKLKENFGDIYCNEKCRIFNLKNNADLVLFKDNNFDIFLKFSEKGKVIGFKRKKIADYLCKELNVHIKNNERYMYCYNKKEGIYELDYGENVKAALVEMFGDLMNIHERNEILDLIFLNKKYWYYDLDKEFNEYQNYINFNNCILDIRNKKQLPHSPEFFFLSKIPHNYDPNAKCPKIEELLKNIFITDGIIDNYDSEIEWIGYLISNINKYKTFTIYTGKADSGKSTYCNLITALLGEKNVSNIEPQDLMKEFYMVKLIGKLANIDPDAGSDKIYGLNKIKKLTGTDRITANVKGKPMIEFRNSAKIMFGCNELPRFDDRSDATYRRLRLIQCLNHFELTEDNPFNFDDYISEEEMSGLINLALEGLDRLIKRGGFVKKNIDDVAEEHDLLSNIIFRFGEDNLEFTDFIFDDFIPSDDLYDRYEIWCKNVNIPVSMPKKTFIREFKNSFFRECKYKQKRINNNRIRGFLGVKFDEF